MARNNNSAVCIRLLAGVVLAAWLSTPALAQEPPPPYCEAHAEHGQFDFWLGEWEVFTNDEARQLAGTNSVTRLSSGCLVFEEWTNTRGQKGYSLNYYDPLDGKWRRQWVSNGAALVMSGGLNEAGEMVMEGEIRLFHHVTPQYPTEIDSFPFRATWTPNADGTVQKLFENYNAETSEWRVWFDAIYVPEDEGLLDVPKVGDAAEAITALLQDQEEAWNVGDFERYMAHVWKSDEFRYVADAVVIHGWQNVMNLYRSYDTPEKRGILSYDNIRVDLLSGDAAVVFADWAVKHPANPSADLSGVMTKIYQKFDGEWVATSVHFSTR